MDFLYTTLPIMVTWQAPRAVKISKIVLKGVLEDFDPLCKKSYWLHLPFFFTNYSAMRGMIPPLMPYATFSTSPTIMESYQQVQSVKRSKVDKFLFTELWHYILYDMMSKFDEFISSAKMSKSLWNFVDFLILL